VLRAVPREDINVLGQPGTSPSARVRLVAALATPRQGPRPEVVVAKTVRALRSVEWLARHFSLSVLIVTRHPLDILASRLDLGWGVSQDAPLPPPGGEATSELQQMAWQIGSFGGGLAAAASRHPDWEVVRHEDLCRAPEDGFKRICDRFHLQWTDAQQEFLGAANRPGSGWNVHRVAADQPDRWKERLTSTQIEEATQVIEALPGGFGGYC
jgi:hypothetical protein